MYKAGDGKANVTAAAGTRIRFPMGGDLPCTRVNAINVTYKAGATPHLLTLMRRASVSQVSAAVAAAGTSLVTSAGLTDGAGNAIAVNDVLAIQLSDFSWLVTYVTSVGGDGVTLGFNDPVPSGKTIPALARICAYGVPSDAYHANQQYTLTASVTTQIPAVGPLTLCKAPGIGEPLILDVDNPTNAGTVIYANWGYTDA